MVVASYVPELFPTAIRMRGFAIASVSGRVASILVPFAVVPLLAAGGPGFVLAGVSSTLLLQALLMLFYREETNSRSLESIAVEVQTDIPVVRTSVLGSK